MECSTPEGNLDVEADYILFAVGRESRLGFLTDEVRSRAEDLQRDGLLHLIGDVGRGMMRQTAIAVGDGVRAAIESHSKLLELQG